MQKVNFLKLVQAVCPEVKMGGLILDILFPFPCGSHDVIYGILWRPSKFILGLVVVGIDRNHIAWSSVANGVIQLHARAFFKSLDGFKDGNSISGAKVKNFTVVCVFVFQQKVNRQRMGMGQVTNMDKVANAGSVSGGIIISENR